MRDALRSITETDYWTYGLSEQDFAYILRLALEFAAAREACYEQEAEKVRCEQPHLAADILDDVAYYTGVDIQYLWHFCLWRLQGIFEGLIVRSFLPSASGPHLTGLRAKLDAARRAGYSLDQDTYEELLAWGKLRNALSHAPPEQFRPGPLEQHDVEDYKSLLERVCAAWRAEEATVKAVSQAPS